MGNTVIVQKISTGRTDYGIVVDTGSVSQNRVEAYIPEEFMLDMEHKWENPFEFDVSKGTSLGLQWLGKQTGLNFTGKFDPSSLGDYLGVDTFTYMGSSPISFTLDLEFLVTNDIDKQLKQPIKNLMLMSVPKKGSLSTLMSLGKPDMVEIWIPGLIHITKAYITNVGTQFAKPLISDGNITVPMRCRVPVTFQTAYIPTDDRINSEFFN